MNEEAEKSEEQISNDPLARFIARLRNIFAQYEDRIQALRDIIDTTTPYASALDEPDTSLAQLSAAVRKVPKERIPQVQELFRRMRNKEITYRQMLQELFENFEREGWNYDLIVALHESQMRQPRLPTLRNSLLTTAVATFEVVVANVATEFYHFRPEALEMNARDREKEFSLRELKQFETINDAIDYTISKRVESLMFGSIADWRRFFNDALKIDLSDLTIDWPEFQEILLRRHVIVHNGGRASRRYVTQVKQSDPNAKVTEGDVLDCEQDYLEYALDHLLVAGTLLVAAVTVKFSRADALSSKLNMLTYSLLRNGRLEAVKRLCKFGMSMPIDQDEILIFKVNMALAVKAQEGIEGISKDITSWDVSALSDVFKLAKASLLGRLDEAFKLLPPLVERGQIGAEELLEWPLFSSMRKDRRFTPIMMPKIEEAGIAHLDDKWVVLNTKTGVVHKPGCRLAKSGERMYIDAPEVQAARRCRICWR